MTSPRLHYFIITAIVAAVHAGAYYGYRWYQTSSESDTVVIPSSVLPPMERKPGPQPFMPITLGAQPTPPAPPVTTRPKIEYNTYKERPIQRRVSAQTPAVKTPAPTLRSTLAQHGKVAVEHAYHHLRHNYRISPTPGFITSVSINTSETAPMEGWGERHRTTGSATINYYLQHNRTQLTTRRSFEVITDFDGSVVHRIDLTIH